MEVAFFKCVLNNLQHELLPLHFKENENSTPVCPHVRFRLNNLKQHVRVLSSLSDYEISLGQRLNPDWMAILKAYKQLIKCDEKDSLFTYIDILEDLSFHFQIFRNRMKLRSRGKIREREMFDRLLIFS